MLLSAMARVRRNRGDFSERRRRTEIRDDGAVSDRVLRIVFVGPLPPPGRGAENFSAQILAELAHRGHSVDAIAPVADGEEPEGERFAQRHPVLRIRRYVMPYIEVGDIPPSPAYRQRETSMIRALLEPILEENPPDVLIAGREGMAVHVAGSAASRRMLIIHGTKMWGVLRGSVPRQLAQPLLEAMRTFDLIITPGRHTQRQMDELGVPGVEVIPNPVDVECFRPYEPPARVRGELRLDGEQIMVLHASKLTEQKRPLDIVSAAEIACERDDRLRFVVAGEGRCREEMELQCRTRGLSEWFRFLGAVPHERMPDLINAAQMVVMPSAFECQALVYLETLACARPLIASDIPAALEVVEDGVNGLLHPEGDTRALAQAILSCAGDPGLGIRLGEQGRITARRHALPQIADAYEQKLLELSARAFGVSPSSSSALCDRVELPGG
jgi:glycosyltransferase involved in cell wall biosynthesis